MMKTTFQAPMLCAMLPMSSLCGAHEVKALKVTILSTMLADDGIGEWGFAALIEADNYSLLLDTGNRPQTVLQNASELKLIGGVHLFRATDEQVDWTADKMSGFKVRYLIGAHCTGIEAVYRLRQRLKLDRHTAVVGAVGASFVLGEGIHPGQIAQ